MAGQAALSFGGVAQAHLLGDLLALGADQSLLGIVVSFGVRVLVAPLRVFVVTAGRFFLGLLSAVTGSRGARSGAGVFDAGWIGVDDRLQASDSDNRDRDDTQNCDRCSRGNQTSACTS